MSHRIARFRLPIAICLLMFVQSPFAAAAQRPAPEAQERTSPAPAPPQVIVGNEKDARETREDFESLLRRLPPEVGRVLRLDPSLMRNDSYLAPYPVLSGFLKQHPEIVQNPAYYLEHVQYEFYNPRQPEDAKTQTVRMWREMLQGIAIFVVMGTGVLALLWLVR